MIKKNAFIIILSAAILGATGCSLFYPKKSEQPSVESIQLAPDEIAFSVMTYNVENLFDLIDDPKKDDNTFLPLGLKKSAKHISNCKKIEVKKWREQCLHWDWNKKVLDTKLNRLAQVIRSGGQDQRGPDLLILQEIENENILSQLKNEHLSDMGYKSLVLIDGKDKRGIDVAFLSRLEVIGKAKLHPIPFKNVEKKRINDTRGILEANFRLPDGNTLTAFAVHFPAPFHPAPMRVQAFEKLNKLAKQLPKDRLYVAGGDFNLTAEEDKNDKVLEKLVSPFWTVAHLAGCKSCKGTHYYPPKKSWSFLDMILFSKSFSNSPWTMRQVKLVNELPFQRTKDNEPQDFDLPDIKGVSDHWPLQVIFTQKVSTL